MINRLCSVFRSVREEEFWDWLWGEWGEWGFAIVMGGPVVALFIWPLTC